MTGTIDHQNASGGTPIARAHEACGRQMSASVFGPHNPRPEWRSLPVWLCSPCSAWEPRGWVIGKEPRGFIADDSLILQDWSGRAGAPLGAFLDGIRVGLSRPGEDADSLRKRLAVHYPGEPLEVLITCINHPDVATVDCLDCAPEG